MSTVSALPTASTGTRGPPVDVPTLLPVLTHPKAAAVEGASLRAVPYWRPVPSGRRETMTGVWSRRTSRIWP